MNSESNIVFKGKIFPRSCTICGVFYQSARHYFVHSRKKVACRPKPYTCSKCGRVFNYYWNLIAHEKRKYSCCVKKSNITLNSNKIEREGNVGEKSARSHKTNTSFMCQKCGTLFCYQKSYEKHCKRCKLSEASPRTLTHFQNATSKLSDEISKSYEETNEFNSPEGKTSKRVSLLYSTSEGGEAQLLPDKSISTDLVPDSRRHRVKHASLDDPVHWEKNADSLDGQLREPKKSYDVSADSESQFICKICNYSFISAYAWSKHMKKHPSFKMPNNCFKCPVCEEVFYSAYILFRHQKRNQHWKRARETARDDENESIHRTTETIFPSEESTLSCTDPNLQREDKLLNSEEKLFDTDSPMMKLRDRSLIRKKIAKAKLQIKNKTARVSLATKKTADRPKCLACGKFVARSCNHGKSFSFNEYFPCKWCSEQFKTVKRVTYHQQKKRRDGSPFECIRCKQRFPTRSCILNHIDRYHKNVHESKLLKDPVESDNLILEGKIKKEEENYAELEEEKRNQVGDINDDNKLDRSSKKELCDEIVHQKLPEDIQRMGGQCTFKCSVCGQIFYNVTSYVSHSLNHFNSNQLDPNEISKTKPYECEICLQKFTHHQKVQIHFLWHLKTIASPSSESSKNVKYIKYQSYSLTDRTSTKARFQIAKKSIFAKVRPIRNTSTNEAENEILMSSHFGEETFESLDSEQKFKPSSVRNRRYHSSRSPSISTDQKGNGNHSQEERDNRLGEDHHSGQGGNRKNSTIEIEESKEAKNIDSGVNKFAETNLHIHNCEENNTNHLGSDLGLKLFSRSESTLGICKNNDQILSHKSGGYEKHLSVLKDSADISNKNNSKCTLIDCHDLSNPHCPYKFPEVNRFLGMSRNNQLTDFEDNMSVDGEASKNLYSLRNHFSQLLYLLVNDPELMQSLGWGQRIIDNILEDVLCHLGRKPVDCEEKLQKLRSNIKLLFEICIKDTVIEKLRCSCSSTDELVANMLLLCENSLKT